MKIVLGLVVVVSVLLGMIAALAHIDGTVDFGEPTENSSAVIDTTAITGEERAYLEFVVGTMQTTSHDINTLGMLFSQPEFEDEGWRTNAAIVLNRMGS